VTAKLKQSRGSGNVFEDLGFARDEADNLLLRAQLMSSIREAARGMTQREAAIQFGVSQPRLNDLMCGKIGKFSLDALVNMLGRAGMRVELKVGGSRPRAPGQIQAPAAHSPAAAYKVTPHSGVGVSRAALARLCRKYGVRKLSLFGSAARKTMNSKSDVDLLVEFAPESRASLFDFPAMQRDFSELFGHRRVDLVPPEVLKNPYRRKTILPDLQTLYEAR